MITYLVLLGEVAVAGWEKVGEWRKGVAGW